MDDDPEIAVSAGLDIPTALALDNDQSSPKTTPTGYAWGVLLGAAIVLANLIASLL